MVRDVFDSQAVAGLKGYMGVGHGEYLAGMRQRISVATNVLQRLAIESCGHGR